MMNVTASFLFIILSREVFRSISINCTAAANDCRASITADSTGIKVLSAAFYKALGYIRAFL
ncbi:hypothetical protein Ga0466249_002394 [Sporomusaceae bacterium BoRhaA]|nr:hypothetical protein [Pelorhabdus rhamnosifermentans]